MFHQIINFLLTHTPLFHLTQSLWRDEAFSVWIAQDSLNEVISRTSGDFNPPLYYLLLNQWINLFGKNEIVLRSLSLIFHFGLVYIMFRIAKILFSQKRAPLFMAFLTFFNPMLLYYGMELRMYSLLAFLSTLSMFALLNKNWAVYIISSALGLYTQPYMLFIILAQNLYLWRMKNLHQAIKNSFIIGMLFLPWIPTLLSQLSHSGPMWIYPIDLNLVSAVLSNLYIGYEGTPGFLWTYMQWTSLLLVFFTFILWRKKPSKELFLLIVWIFLPISIVLFASLVKPLYVARYLIMVTPALVLLIGQLTTKLLPERYHAATFVLIVLTTIMLTFWFAPYKTKVDIRSGFNKISTQIGQNDIVVAETPLVYYESIYYAPKHTRVFLYNPLSINPPRYVGSVGMPEEVWISSFPKNPIRAYLIHEDGSFTIHSQQ